MFLTISEAPTKYSSYFSRTAVIFWFRRSTCQQGAISPTRSIPVRSTGFPAQDTVRFGNTVQVLVTDCVIRLRGYLCYGWTGPVPGRRIRGISKWPPLSLVNVATLALFRNVFQNRHHPAIILGCAQYPRGQKYWQLFLQLIAHLICQRVATSGEYVKGSCYLRELSP